MPYRVTKLVKDFFSVLGECLLSEFPFPDGDGIVETRGGILGGILELALLGVLFSVFLLLVYGFFSVTYDLMFDPNSTDVASRLSSLSISPNKWA